MRGFSTNILKFVFPSIIFLLLSRNVITHWHEVSSILNGFRAPPLFLSFVSFLFIYPESAFTWFVLIKKLGSKISLKNALYVWVVSNASRYIPGTIWQYVGRVELALKFGVPRKTGMASVLYEAFLMIVAGCLMSVFSFNQWGILGLKPQVVLAGLAIPLIFLHPAIVNKLLKLLAKIMKKEKVSNIHVKIKDYFILLPLFLLNFILNGLGLLFLVYSFTGKLEHENIFVLSGVYALSWLAGYFSIFAPGGLGVTEASLALLLSFQIPLSLASAISIIYRSLLIIAELVSFIVILGFRKWQPIK